MNNETKPQAVDVLAVMDRAQSHLWDHGGASLSMDLTEARAAVAELVEAAAALVTRAESNVRSCGEVEMDCAALRNARAALARIGGQP